MNEKEQRAILTISLMAAFADGRKDDREQEQLKQIAGSLASSPDMNLPTIYQDVILKRITTADVSSNLESPESRQLAFEMAVCVCDADGIRNDAEQAFLDGLRTILGLDAAKTQNFTRQSAAIAEVPVTSGGPPESVKQSAAKQDAAGAAALDKMILNYAILNGALELLPQSLASMAILPLQMKMVYAIGKSYGYELDRGHIKDFAATLGVGITGQYVEQMGRKLLGGLLRTVGGGLAGGLGSLAVGASFSFATTYALGQVARQYYAGGRTIDLQQLKSVFASLLEQGKDLQRRYTGEIQQRARTINVNEIAGLVRGT